MGGDPFNEHGAGRREPADAGFLDSAVRERGGPGLPVRAGSERRQFADLAPALTAFLERAEREPFVWGSWDCCLYPAAWVQTLTGIDPARRWRGAYDDQDGALAFVRAGRGLARVMEVAAAEAGLVRAPRPSLGAVGVIRSEDPDVRLMGAVCVGGGFWSTVAPEGGVVALRTRPVAAWEV